VENWPKEVITGHNPQLERAVQEAMRQLKERPVNRMSTEPPQPTSINCSFSAMNDCNPFHFLARHP